VLHRSLKNLSYILSSDLLSRLLGFLVTAYLARVLGVEKLGLMGFAMAALSYGLIVTDLGLLKLGTREIARDRSHAEAYAAGIVSLRIILAVVAFAGLGLFALIAPRSETAKFLVLGYALLVFPTALQLEWVFQGREELGHIAISRLLTYACYLVLVFAAVKSSEDVLRVPLIWLAANLLSVLYLVVVYRIRVGQFRLSLNLAFWGLLMQAGLPLGIGTVLGQVYMNFGPLALGLLSTAVETGFYTVAFRVAYLALLVDRMFYSIVFPVVARRVKPQPAGMTVEQAYQGSFDTMQQLAKLILIIVLPVAFCGMVLARPVVLLLFGADYALAGPVLAILIWLVVTTTLNSLYAYGLIAAGREREYAWNVASGTTVVLLLSLSLAVQLKAVGAAMAVVAGEALMLILMFRGFRRIVRVNPLPALLRPLAVSAGLGALLWRFPPDRLAGRLTSLISLPLSPRLVEGLVLALTIILALAIYLGIMYLVGGIGQKELDLWRGRNRG
jgi:O-antigen/teichoic acid export membrane protein